ncbi:MAG: integrase [Deltaproteobacteria bacterium]|nr:integrase [Deltaproteobacteria bacterium]
MTDIVLSVTQNIMLPSLIFQAGDSAQKRFLDFFLVTIRNPNTRAAYGYATGAFFKWCEYRGVSLSQVTPMVVSAYVEQHPGSPLTIKQHLAAIRCLFDHLATGGIVPFNPAAPVKGPRYKLTKGKTPVLDQAEAAGILAACDISTIVGMRDRALFSVMLYSFARISAVLATKIEDYYRKSGRAWLRLHEKGGRFHEVPLHHAADRALSEYLEAASVKEKKAWIFQSTDPSTGQVTGRAMTRASALERVKTAANVAGLGDKVSNHSFRATGITLYRKAGGTLDKAQQIAGHANAETTRLYDRSGDEISAAEVERIQLDTLVGGSSG